MAKSLRLRIGDIVFALVPEGNNANFKLDASYIGFITEDPPDVTLRIHSTDINLAPGEKVFDSGGIWSLYQCQDKWLVYINSPRLGPEPYQKIILQSDFCAGDIYFTAVPAEEDRVQYPFAYPVSELIMVNLLSKGRGALLHAFSVKDRTAGLLFAGKSGAGKSTNARLWAGAEGATLLSDDRVIVRKHESNFWIYGTPWHGDASVVSPESAPLEKIFILKHASKNHITPLEPGEAAARLLVRSFPTFWDADGMDFTLQFLGDMCETLPCYELGFVPDKSVVDFVRDLVAQ